MTKPTFKRYTWREKKQQAFDPNNIFIEQAGKKKNVFQMIQEAREDTELMPTLLKYGSIDRMILDEKEMFGEFQIMHELRDIYDQQKQAEKMFYNLPIEVRQEFNNNIQDFVNNGEKYLQKIINEKEQKPVETENTEVKTNE